MPLARPALAAGVALAMMEALADFGTVASFGYRTLTEAIYRVWYGMFDRIAATQLASVLLLFAAGLLLLERHSRGRARFTQGDRRRPVVEPLRLAGWRAAAATATCVGVLGLAFLLPVGQLAWWAIDRDPRAARGPRLRRAALAAPARWPASPPRWPPSSRCSSPMRAASTAPPPCAWPPSSSPWATRCRAR